jgi:neutral ceramidase
MRNSNWKIDYNMKDSRRNFIKKIGGAAVTMITPGIVVPATFSGSPTQNSAKTKPAPVNEDLLSSGFAEVDISPKPGMERPGNYMKIIHKDFYDPCKIRAAVFDDGKKKTALVSIDALMVPRALVVAARNRITKQCGIAYEAILIGATHSHSAGPIGMVQPGQFDHASEFVQNLAYNESSAADAGYLKLVEDELVSVVCRANDSLQSTYVGVGIGHETGAGANRRFYMKNGGTFTYPGRGNPDIINPAGPIDPEVGVIGVWNEEKECIGCVVNFARHANTASGISAGWPYFMEQIIRGAMGPDCIVVFLSGAAGDISHDRNDPYASHSGRDRPRYVGSLVGGEVVKVLMKMARGNMVPIAYDLKVVELNRRMPSPERVKKCYELTKKSIEEVGRTDWLFAKEIVLLDAIAKKDPKVEVEVQAVQIGPVVLVTNPAEYFVQLGLNIKKGSQFKYTFPVTLANGAIGYVPTLEAFGPNGGGYETRLTSYSNLEITAGNQIVNLSLELIRKMQPGIEPTFPAPPPFKEPWSYGNVKPELE